MEAKPADTSQIPADMYRGIIDHVQSKYPKAFEKVTDPQGHEVIIVRDQREQVHYDGYLLAESGIFATMTGDMHKRTGTEGNVQAKKFITEKGIERLLADIKDSPSVSTKDKMIKNSDYPFYIAELDPRESDTRSILKGVLEDAQQRGEKGEPPVSLQQILSEL